VTVWYTDIAGNKSEPITVAVPASFEPRTGAEALGKSVVGVYEVGGEQVAEHRFVLPVTITRPDPEAEGETAAAPETTALTVPVLAYKGYKVGELTVTQNGDTATISAAMDDRFLYDGAGASIQLFSSEPTLDDLRATDGRAGVSLDQPIDLSAYEGVMWVYARFDVEVDAETLYFKDGFVNLTPQREGLDPKWQGMDGETYSLYTAFQAIGD
jgi:hypothetical protein